MWPLHPERAPAAPPWRRRRAPAAPRRRRRRGLGRRGDGRRVVGCRVVGRRGVGVDRLDGTLVDAGDLVGGRLRASGDRLVDDRVLLSDRGRLGVLGQDVGRHGRVDRRRDVGVGRDGTVDRRCQVGVQVDVDVDVEQVALEQVAGVELAEAARDVIQHLADRADEVAGGVEHLPGERLERADHVAGGVDDVARGTVEGSDHVAGGVEDRGAVHEVGHAADHGAHRVQDLAGQGIERPDHVAGGVDHVAGHRIEDAEDLAVGPGDARTVHEVGDRSDQVAGRVDHHAGGLVERAEDVAVGADDVAGGAVEGADDVAGGVHHHAAVDRLARRAGKAVGGVAGLGARREHGLIAGAAFRRSCAARGRVALVDGAVLDAGRDRVGVDRLRDLDTLVGQCLAVEPSLSRLALTAASIGATTLALRATARSIGAAPSIARSTSAARSRIETTSLSGSAVMPSLASSSGVSGARSSVLIVLPPMGSESCGSAATVMCVSPNLDSRRARR